MKTAAKIWEEFSAKKITSKEAFEAINERLKVAKADESMKLIKLSEKILDMEVPMEERDEESEKMFWDATHREPQE